MPPHKWVDNAELSVPDQMTNITEKTRLHSYLQLREGRPNTQGAFKTLGLKLASDCVSVCVGGGGGINVSQASSNPQ